MSTSATCPGYGPRERTHARRPTTTDTPPRSAAGSSGTPRRSSRPRSPARANQQQTPSARSSSTSNRLLQVTPTVPAPGTRRRHLPLLRAAHRDRARAHGCTGGHDGPGEGEHPTCGLHCTRGFTCGDGARAEPRAGDSSSGAWTTRPPAPAATVACHRDASLLRLAPSKTSARVALGLSRRR